MTKNCTVKNNINMVRDSQVIIVCVILGLFLFNLGD